MVAPLFARSRLTGRAPETLYNGITLGTPWPPRLRYPDEHPVTPPYLLDPPAVIPIDVGRQLFVDDFLIEETVAAADVPSRRISPGQPRPAARDRVGADATPSPNAPRPRSNPAAMPFSDGVFFDPRDRLFKMWYMGGYGTDTRATRPRATASPGQTGARRRPRARTSSVTQGSARAIRARCGSTSTTGSARRYKMSLWYDHYARVVGVAGRHPLERDRRTGRAGDRTTFFYNPFRRVWVFSLRGDAVSPAAVATAVPPLLGDAGFRRRGDWNGYEPVAWVGADCARSARAEA